MRYKRFVCVMLVALLLCQIAACAPAQDVQTSAQSVEVETAADADAADAQPVKADATPDTPPVEQKIQVDKTVVEDSSTAIRLIDCSYMPGDGVTCNIEITNKSEDAQRYDLEIALNGFVNIESTISMLNEDGSRAKGYTNGMAFIINADPGTNRITLTFDPIDNEQYRALIPIDPLYTVSLIYQYDVYDSESRSYITQCGSYDVVFADGAPDTHNFTEIYSDDRVRVEQIGYMKESTTLLLALTYIDDIENSSASVIPEIGGLFDCDYTRWLGDLNGAAASTHLDYAPDDTFRIVKVFNIAPTLSVLHVDSIPEMSLWIGSNPNNMAMQDDAFTLNEVVIPLDTASAASLPALESYPVVWENEEFTMREIRCEDAYLYLAVENKTDTLYGFEVDCAKASTGDVTAHFDGSAELWKQKCGLFSIRTYKDYEETPEHTTLSGSVPLENAKTIGFDILRYDDYKVHNFDTEKRIEVTLQR